MRSLLKYNTLFIILLSVLTSCSSYSRITAGSRVTLPEYDTEQSFKGNSYSRKYSDRKDERRIAAITLTKYLASGNGCNPESFILKTGVDEAVKGNYLEAEILFTQVQGVIKDGSVENNLAVIYEFTKRKNEAHAMYLNALIKSPENLKFRSNLLSFIKQNKFKADNNNFQSEN